MSASDPAPVALVTGGAIRVGRAICRALAADGFRVAIHHHGSTSAAAELARELAGSADGAVPLQADLTRPGARPELIEGTIAAFGRLDLLVNSAALFVDDAGPIGDLARMKILNFDAPAALIELAVDHLAPVGGSVINIADVAGMRRFSGYQAYSRTKSALLSLTQRRALELAPRGVRVNAICPGAVLFPDRYDEDKRRKIVVGIPLGRAGSAGDVGHAAVFLARASYVTGQAIAVDGGRLLAALTGEDDSKSN